MQGIALHQIEHWTHARVVGIFQPANSVRGISTDTRTIRRGDVYLALKGKHHDGHRFVAEAFERGAVAAIVEEAWERRRAHPTERPLLIVDSPLRALGAIAREYRSRFTLPVICVVGSAGKTTTKEMIAAVLEQQYCVLKNRDNENNEVGVPKTVLQLEPSHQALVLELGARRIGDIRYLCAIAQPTTGVLLNIGTAHLGLFGSVERVAKAKGELLEYLDESSTVLINIDDCTAAREAKRSKGRLLGFGLRGESEFRGERFALDQEGCGHFSLQHTQFNLRIPGRHNVYNALAAAGVGHIHGVPWPGIALAINQFQPIALRSEIHRAAGGWTLLDDSYNANPESVRAAVDLLARIAAKRRIAVLGDMLELGPDGPRLHHVLGRYIATSGIDLLLTTGPLSRHTALGAEEISTVKGVVRHFTDTKEMIRHLQALVRAGDVVLVKGSRATGLEAVADILLRRATL